MSLLATYDRAKRRLLSDDSICPENRALFEEFLGYEEYKLRRINGLTILDDNSCKTLLAYTTRLRVVNRWFRNKPWKQLEHADIQQVYDDLEDGRIVTNRGRPLKDKTTYYNLILRGKPFEMAGKKELIGSVMRFIPGRRKEEVRFIKELDFRKLVEVTSREEHRAFLWMCWDIGENAASILKLRKRDCVRQINEHTQAPEYLIHLRREILKRSRRSRSEFTNYKETVEYLDHLLSELQEDDLLFDFGEGWGKKVLLRAVARSGVRCLPAGHRPTLKDLRSSMACDLLSKGWSRDEVNARLGHTPSSREIDRYINYLALDRLRPKEKLAEDRVMRLAAEITHLKDREKHMAHQLRQLTDARRAETEALKKMVTVHAQIAALTIERQLGQIDNSQYVADLLREHERLLKASRAWNELNALTGASSDGPVAENDQPMQTFAYDA